MIILSEKSQEIVGTLTPSQRKMFYDRAQHGGDPMIKRVVSDDAVQILVAWVLRDDTETPKGSPATPPPDQF